MSTAAWRKEFPTQIFGPIKPRDRTGSCANTAHGCEIDHAEVISGTDLRYDSATGAWLADKTKKYDGTVKRSGADLVRPNSERNQRMLRLFPRRGSGQIF